jgi:hypothetical protein
MEDTGDIHRYAYFMAREGLLVNNQGNGLSDIGSYYTFWHRSNGGFNSDRHNITKPAILQA